MKASLDHSLVPILSGSACFWKTFSEWYDQKASLASFPQFLSRIFFPPGCYHDPKAGVSPESQD